MPVPYAGDPDVYPATVDLATGSDLKTAASVAVGDQGALDRTAYLKKRLIGQQVVVPLAPINIYGLSNEGAAVADRFQFSAVANLGLGWLQTDITDGGLLTFALAPLPVVARITHVEMRIACLAQAGLPGTMPQISLLKEDTSTMVSVVTLATKADTSLQPAFESSHIVSIDCAADIGGIIDFDAVNDVLYYVTINGQAGVNALANKFMVKQVYAIIEVP